MARIVVNGHRPKRPAAKKKGTARNLAMEEDA
jgi:hypothetical protein